MIDSYARNQATNAKTQQLGAPHKPEVLAARSIQLGSDHGAGAGGRPNKRRPVSAGSAGRSGSRAPLFGNPKTIKAIWNGDEVGTVR
jgi:hypothetical protein